METKDVMELAELLTGLNCFTRYEVDDNAEEPLRYARQEDRVVNEGMPAWEMLAVDTTMAILRDLVFVKAKTLKETRDFLRKFDTKDLNKLKDWHERCQGDITCPSCGETWERVKVNGEGFFRYCNCNERFFLMRATE